VRPLISLDHFTKQVTRFLCWKSHVQEVDKSDSCVTNMKLIMRNSGPVGKFWARNPSLLSALGNWLCYLPLEIGFVIRPWKLAFF